MKATIMVLTLAVAVIGPAALTQPVDQLLRYWAPLNAELARRKQLGMASVDDLRWGSGATYTSSVPIEVLPLHSSIDPQPAK